MLAEAARALSDEYIANACKIIGCGYRRMQRVAKEYALTFKEPPPRRSTQNNMPKRSPLEAGRVVFLGGFFVKRCSCCTVTKKVEQFNSDSTKASGVSSWCKECSKSRYAKRFKVKNDI